MRTLAFHEHLQQLIDTARTVPPGHFDVAVHAAVVEDLADDQRGQLGVALPNAVELSHQFVIGVYFEGEIRGFGFWSSL